MEHTQVASVMVDVQAGPGYMRLEDMDSSNSGVSDLQEFLASSSRLFSESETESDCPRRGDSCPRRRLSACFGQQEAVQWRSKVANQDSEEDSVESDGTLLRHDSHNSPCSSLDTEKGGFSDGLSSQLLSDTSSCGTPKSRNRSATVAVPDTPRLQGHVKKTRRAARQHSPTLYSCAEGKQMQCAQPLSPCWSQLELHHPCNVSTPEQWHSWQPVESPPPELINVISSVLPHGGPMVPHGGTVVQQAPALSTSTEDSIRAAISECLKAPKARGPLGLRLDSSSVMKEWRGQGGVLSGSLEK